MRKYFDWIFLLIWLTIPALAFSDYYFNGPKAVEVQRHLENEFQSIASMPNTTPYGYSATHGIRKSLVGMGYATDSSFLEIRKFYNDALIKRGWKFVSENKQYDWGRDFGGKRLEYCKSSYVASIIYHGSDRDSYGVDFNFYLSWGLQPIFGDETKLICKPTSI